MIKNGTVKWFSTSKGYGFIKPDHGTQDVFVHISALKAAGLDNLEDNQRVKYEIVEEKGKMSAGNIQKLIE